METKAHLRLKNLALAWLLREGFQVVAPEVRTPIMRYRADVAGYIDALPYAGTKDHAKNPAPNPPATKVSAGDQDVQWGEHVHLDDDDEGWEAEPGGIEGGVAGGVQHILPFHATTPPGKPRAKCEPRTVLVECKQARSDFLRDTGENDRLLARREKLLEQKHQLEREIIRHNEPDLRESGQFLFSEMERWDFSRSRSPSYRKLLDEIAGVDKSLYAQTKFFWMAQYRMADRLFIFAPRAMIKPRELPDAWGLIECPKRFFAAMKNATFEQLADVPLKLRSPARDNHTRATHRVRLLRNIAAAATRAHVRTQLGPTP